MLFASGMCRVVVVTELQLETVATVALAQFSENPFCLIFQFLSTFIFYVKRFVLELGLVRTYKDICTYVCVV